MQREINKIFVPVYVELLRNKKYAQRFDSKAIGTMYRLLAANIWRADTADTAARGYRGEVFQTLAKEYEAGNLVSYFDDKTLAEMLGVTPRYIRKLRAQLIELGLVEAKQVENGAAKYYYKLGEVIAKADYGYLHEVLFIDKWLADIQDVVRGKKKRPDFEDALEKLSNSSKESTVSEFSHDALTALHEQVMKASESIFLGKGGTTVPEGRNYSSGPRPLTKYDEDGKESASTDNTNKMNYNEPLPSKEGIYKQTPTPKKKKSKGTEEQYSLFGTTKKQPNYREKLQVAIDEDLNKVPGAIIKLVKNEGKEKASAIVAELFKAKGLNVPDPGDKEFFVKSWEAAAAERVNLVPQKYLSTNSFLTGWWLMHTVDTNSPGRRNNITRIRSVMANFVDKVSGNIDNIIGAIRFMREFLKKKKGATILFTQPEHMYKALETYLAYYLEARERKAKEKGTTQSTVEPESLDTVCESSMMEATEGEFDGWTLDTHKNVLKSKKYLPKHLKALSLMQRFDLWKEGLFNDTLLPKKKYRDKQVPENCWNDLAINEATFVTITYWKDPMTDPVTAECILRKFVERYTAGTWNPIGVYCTEEELNAVKEEMDGD